MKVRFLCAVALASSLSAYAADGGIDLKKSFTQLDCSETKPVGKQLGYQSDFDDGSRSRLFYPFVKAFGGVHREFSLLSGYIDDRSQTADYFYTQIGTSRVRYFETTANFNSEYGANKVALYCFEIERAYIFPKV
ncbi:MULTISPECIES: hypothetical protein [unclassified Shewanella]|uniref:hypothetical protein n=1 Tax=unclassified Shewanella TaxID=196818 RepID=UPI001F06DC3A|nr:MULTISPECIES: hypothetical protein [unclassified Shewanella]